MNPESQNLLYIRMKLQVHSHKCLFNYLNSNKNLKKKRFKKVY